MTFLQGKKGVWIKLPIQLATLIEIVVKVIYIYISFQTTLTVINSLTLFISGGILVSPC